MNRGRRVKKSDCKRRSGGRELSKRCLFIERLEPRVVLDSTVVFNEIMYHPETNEAESEWIELYNQLAVNMDISHWRLEGGVRHEFAEGTVVPGGGYLVVPIDPLQPSEPTPAGFTGRLANNGEQVRLVNNNDRTMSVIGLATVYGNSRHLEENSNTVDVDSVDATETQSDNDGGEL